jgi:hypothetical protein
MLKLCSTPGTLSLSAYSGELNDAKLTDAAVVTRGIEAIELDIALLNWFSVKITSGLSARYKASSVDTVARK